ncbi:ATP-dependent helicase [Nocardioides daejeonensis]|uniref:ATP-dependent helicase n=1 Tax=Nocardioides daejeonensis TaxID=1046556 RepID=UPI000D74BCC3|nr:ATP-dependent DNA helicase [Nocardioides daejeonensis]
MTHRVIQSPADLQRVMQTDFMVSDQQWAAISAPLEPAVVIAGAGSGKTALMAARVVYLVVNGEVSPDQVLGLTFTTKAASELRGRIRGALEVAGALAGPRESGDVELMEPTVATYNAYAAALLTDHGLLIGHEPDTRVMADGSRYQLAVRAVQRHRLPIEQLSDHPETVVNYILALEGAMSEHLVDPQALLDLQEREHRAFTAALTEARAKSEIKAALSALERRDELIGLVGTYRALKAELGLMDFSDQIALAARLADLHPTVGEHERGRFRIVLLDEYQDTSVAQALMLRRLFSGPDAEHGRGHAVTAVGDPNQAIYGWRGASVSNILGFGADFPRADGGVEVPVFPLTVNRRSDRRILAVANRLAAPLLTRFPQVRPLEAPAGVPEGTVRVLVHESHPAELAWLPDQVLTAHQRLTDERPGEAVWREIGVLVRDNAHAAEVFDALSAREIPVEIVGLAGLLRLPEVAEVVATLTLMHDLTANAALLTLLTGPRWAIGPRDLALLGKRAKELAGEPQGRSSTQTLAEQLDTAVGGADPTEVRSLCDALEDPGEHPYSSAARTRFALLAGELRWLRSHTGEPLLDLVRRIIDACGIDVELASSTSPAASARRDNLDLFVKAVADFRAVDGDVSLAALLAYLQAEDELGNGLDVATPTEADSVKLLTVHRSKGLEWDVVFCLGVCEEKFPNTRGRSLWISAPGVLPTPLRGDARDLPALGGHEKEHLVQLREESRQHDALEELRLGYVAFTRARHELVVSSWLWTEGRKSPLGPSPFQQTIADLLAEWGEAPEAWLEKPDKEAPNPLQEAAVPVPWPVTEHTAEALRRLEAAERVRDADADAPDDLDMVEAALVAEWDAELDRLLAEARRGRRAEVVVPLPSSLSATSLRRLRDDPEEFARDLARPMPRPPSDSASFGTRFHAWVEARVGQQNLLDPDDLPGQADRGIDDDADLRRVTEAFERGPFAERQPLATEAPFALVLAGQVVRGRIDAVYAEPEGGYLVVDWKTGRREESDLLQLALYRLAWAELHQVPLESVRAAFHYVRSGRTADVTEQLPGRAELETLVVGGSGSSSSLNR